jgi:S1-C subfamily serine protease
MKIRHIFFPLSLAFCGLANAQGDGGVPLLTLEEKQAIDDQADEFNRAIMPALATAANSTVRVWSGTRRLAYGTVVGNGDRVLTKWSELSRARGDLRVEAVGSELRAVQLLGVYAEHDLALLAIEGTPLPAVQWAAEEPGLGRFLAAPQPDGRLAAFGVVAVTTRNLRESDQAYLGVLGESGHGGSGVRVTGVKHGSGAAVAGIRMGDIIRTIEGREISGIFELRNALNGIGPGDNIRIELERNGSPLTLEVPVGSRPEVPRFPGARIQQMDRMGGPISQVRDGFPSAIESDMRLQPNQVGGPVVDLNGRVVGITLARAGRTRSFVMPANAIQAMLETPPGNPASPQTRVAVSPNDDRHQGIHEPAPDSPPRAMPVPEPDGGNAPDTERLGRHLSDMQRLLEMMWQEMDTLEP